MQVQSLRYTHLKPPVYVPFSDCIDATFTHSCVCLQLRPGKKQLQLSKVQFPLLTVNAYMAALADPEHCSTSHGPPDIA